ncbi:DUF6480 family protein [Streptomyces sp. NPDC087908]|uniref:DUF6480 family protein n=1 Tax=unclassified Streptomyces TaxID=2593676 RepID=UPI0011CDC55C|nr:DUF6480 family protein [Streptomyces sp. adm13(2018)]TXS22858.1 hypothetical protein EAO70_05505 [Streptomyces sp. adm13(2018)]
MTQPLVPPQETPPAEGSTSSAHQERADGGIWEHPRVWLALISAGAVLGGLFFLFRFLSF